MNQELTTLPIIFLTGLTTGGLTCLAIQGGLLTSVIAKKNTTGQSGTTVPVTSFLLGKLASHTLLGFLLGLLGSTITLNPVVRGWLQVFIGLYLFGIAGNLLELHPFFRYFVITPPKFLAKIVRNKSTFGPAILGFLTVLIPCATTQAMMLLSLGTSNPVYSAAIMFSFVLGTFPTFLLFGFLLEKGSTNFQRFFPQVAATIMFIMSVYIINSGVALTGSPYTIQNFYQAATQNATQNSDSQEITITVTNTGYSPNNITLKRGVPTMVKLITKDVESCSRSFVIPNFGIEKLLPETGETVIEFTPDKTGPLAFSCSMGMYTGLFNVVN